MNSATDRRREDFPTWVDWAQAVLDDTIAELSLSPAAWELVYGTRHPGDGYTATLRAQVKRFTADIANARRVK